MTRDIRQIWFFEHSAEMVWKFLTTPELLAKWLMPNDFKALVGHEFQFRTKPKVKIGFDGIVYCKVLEVLPMKRISYTWRGGPGNGKITLDSVVRWTLTPKNAGTELLLEHTGFSGMKNFISYIIMNRGWRVNIQNRLRKDLNNTIHETSIR